MPIPVWCICVEIETANSAKPKFDHLIYRTVALNVEYIYQETVSQNLAYCLRYQNKNRYHRTKVTLHTQYVRFQSILGFPNKAVGGVVPLYNRLYNGCDEKSCESRNNKR